MAKGISTDLFDLVSSLSRTEKRYFKVFAARHVSNGDNNSLKVFDVVDKQVAIGQYNEKEILQKFRKEKFINQLPRVKNYLQELILKSLAQYHGEKTVTAKLNHWIIQIEILYNKGLYKHCGKLIAKTKSLAEMHELWPILLTAQQWERRLVLSGIYPEVNPEKFKQLMSEEEKIIRRIGHLNLRCESLFLGEDNGSPRPKIDQPTEPFVPDEAGHSATSFKEQVYNHYLKATRHFENGRHKKAYHYSNLLIQLFESKPELLKEQVKNYLISLSNHITLCFQSGKHLELLQSFNRLHLFLSDNTLTIPPGIRAKLFIHSYIIGLQSYLQKGIPDEETQMAAKIEEGLQELKPHIKPEALKLLFYNTAYYCFVSGAYESALDWVNKVLNDTSDKIRPDIHCQVKILNILIHFELGNFLLIENLIVPTKRFLVKKGFNGAIEKAILDFFQHRVLKAGSQKEISAQLNILRTQLYDLSQQTKHLLYFNYFSWIHSKVHGKRFIDVVKQDQDYPLAKV